MISSSRLRPASGRPGTPPSSRRRRRRRRPSPPRSWAAWASRSTTDVSAPAAPTCDASSPASASDSVVTFFFFAAMIPLNDGYRGSLIFSPTLTTAGSSADSITTPSSVSRRTVSVLALDRDLAGVGQRRQPQHLGDHRRHRRRPPVRRLVAGQHQVHVPDGADHAGQRPRRADRVRAGQGLVGQVHRRVGAHRQRLADRLGGPVRAHRHDGHRAAVGLLELQRLLDGALVDLVEHRVGGVPVQGTVRPATGARSRCRAPACTERRCSSDPFDLLGPTPGPRRVHKCYQPVSPRLLQG